MFITSKGRMFGWWHERRYRMAFFSGNVYSYELDKMTPLEVYLPFDDNRRFNVDKDKPQNTLILLHGLEGNCSYWGRYTSVERYAQSRNIALIMPEADKSMYTDMVYGLRYNSYISKELPEMIKGMFNINTDREHLFIAGLSMGGYGAVRIALTNSEKFSRCASFSGALMIGSKENMDYFRHWTDPGRSDQYIEMTEIERSMRCGMLSSFGGELKYNPQNDIIELGRLLIESGKPVPEFLFTCGTEDFLYDDNIRYIEALRSEGISSELYTWHGIHNWLFWEESIRDHIGFFAD